MGTDKVIDIGSAKVDVDITKKNGDYFRQKYLEKQDPLKIAEYKKRANDYINELTKELDKLINDGKTPIATKSTMVSKNGIFAPDREMENLFKDFLFSTILSDIADERSFRVEATGQPIGIDKNTNQPVISLVMTLTFK